TRPPAAARAWPCRDRRAAAQSPLEDSCGGGEERGDGQIGGRLEVRILRLEAGDRRTLPGGRRDGIFALALSGIPRHDRVQRVMAIGGSSSTESAARSQPNISGI